jgi:hypothetical protein
MPRYVIHDLTGPDAPHHEVDVNGTDGVIRGTGPRVFLGDWLRVVVGQPQHQCLYRIIELNAFGEGSWSWVAIVERDEQFEPRKPLPPRKTHAVVSVSSDKSVRRNTQKVSQLVFKFGYDDCGPERGDSHNQ